MQRHRLPKLIVRLMIPILIDCDVASHVCPTQRAAPDLGAARAAALYRPLEFPDAACQD